MESDEILALILVICVRKALERGIKHYDMAGNLLATDLQVLSALDRDGTIHMRMPDDEPGPAYFH